MSAIETIKSLFAFSPAPSTKAIGNVFNTDTYTGTSLAAYGPTGQVSADWSGISNTPNLERSYRLCATAYACATFLADAVAESPLRVYRINPDGELEEQPRHRARTILANPNPYMSEAEFMSLTVMMMALFGYAAIEKVRSAAGLPVQLWPLRPDWLKLELLNDGSTRWVLRRPRMDPRIIEADDIILIPYRADERQEKIGISPLHIVGREIGIDVGLTDLLKVFLDAGGIPPWAVELPTANPDQAEVDVFREKWAQRYGGARAYSQIGILHGGMKLVKVGDSIGDMAWSELRGITELKIAQAYRVPADLIQAKETLKGGSLTTTEMDGAMSALQKYGAAPLRQRIDGAFSRAFMSDFGDASLTVEFDISAILSLQEDNNALHDRVRADWDAGLIMLNEARYETGRPDLGSAGEVFKTAFTTVYLPVKQLTDTATVPSVPPAKNLPITAGSSNKFMETAFLQNPVYRNRKTMTEAEIATKANALTVTARDRTKLTQILDRKLRAYWKDLGRRLVDSLPKKFVDVEPSILVAGMAIQPKQETPSTWSQKDTLFDWDGELRQFSALMEKFYAETGKAAYTGINSITGASITFDLANPNIQRMMTELGTRVVGINETTRLDVSKIITNGLAEGMSPPQIAQDLTGLFEQTYKNRAGTVARTESMYAYNTASTIGYQESGVVDRCELVDNPDHEDDYGASDGLTCAQRDGMVVDLADVDRHIEAEHPNGSLAIIPLLSGPALGET